MHVDAMLGPELRAAAAGARALEEQGFEAAWCGETPHDPSLPHAPAASTTRRMHLGTGVAIAHILMTPAFDPDRTRSGIPRSSWRESAS
jgi:alkanesulfonate monooxygenase SsuD/methylene tetrahydromethanopterin reductase-like flavin-dependent oxidoreductase (luciferase family)